MPFNRRELIQGSAAGAVGLVAGGVLGRTLAGDGGDDTTASGLSGDAGRVAEARGFTPENVTQAVSTFVPPGEYDEFYLFASGGHSGQVIVFGVPSLRVLKIIGVFTPEPWQGFGYGADWGEKVMTEGTLEGKEMSAAAGRLTWGDTHHPALSETNAEYDGRWCYINDRANGRIAMIDLRDFKTKEIFDIPNLQTSHGGCFVTQNTEYVHISTMTPTLVDDSDIDNALENYSQVFRGFSTFLAVNPDNGHFDKERSFQVELPPYIQDLADSGKLVSDGWVFINSYNSEMATGGNMEGGDPLEVGASQAEFDYLHVINWRRAEEAFAADKVRDINGMPVIPIEVAVEEGILYLVPEPRSPHGVDVAPNGNYLTVSGKLDPHVTVYSFEKLMEAIDNEDFQGTDEYGIPIVNYDSVVAGRVEVGAGPLHTQYDADGYGYTSLFIESAVAKWSLGEPYHSGDEAFQLVDKLPIHYNIGHLTTMEGDTAAPQGKYLVSLNKWSVDRFPVTGTLKPQNFQMVGLDGEQMALLSDCPIGIGEPHYTQAIRADRVQSWEVYPPGTNPATMEVDANATATGEERVEREGNNLEIWATVRRSTITPDTIRARTGDHVKLHLTNVETTPDATHGFAMPRYNMNISLDAGEVTSVEFDADEPGAFAFYCTEFCSALHLEMQGWMLVS